MPSILLAVASILIITAIAWGVNQASVFQKKICPICAGVLLTWVWLVAAMFMGSDIDPVVPAILMGASVTGITHAMQGSIKSSTASLLFKATFLLTGLLTVYSLILGQWALFFLGLAASTFIVFLFRQPRAHKESKDGCC